MFVRNVNLTQTCRYSYVKRFERKTKFEYIDQETVFSYFLSNCIPLRVASKYHIHNQTVNKRHEAVNTERQNCPAMFKTRDSTQIKRI